MKPQLKERIRKTNIYNKYALPVNEGSKFIPNEEDKELIGIQNAKLYWASEIGIDVSTTDAGNSGLHLSIFDVSTRADSAQIKLLNDSGSGQYVIATVIKAMPIMRLSGEQGFLHDSFVDYQDIFLNGENTFEFGNNFIVTKDQLEQLADYYAKTLGVIQGDTTTPLGTPLKAKHIYSISIPGRCWWFEPGEWYTLQIGGAGQREYIDSVCECYGVQVEAAADGLGVTRIDFREVEQNWVKDSDAIARFLATGDPRWKPNNFGRVVVASSTYMGTADYYCDGTDDQTDIQAAIDFLAGTGGGLVELTEGQYNITAAIELANGIILHGTGKNTVIEKNCNDYAIEANGTSGTHLENIMIENLRITRNTADTNSIAFIDCNYIDNLSINKCILSIPYSIGIQVTYCSGIINTCLIDGENASYASFVNAITSSYCENLIISQNTIRDFNTASACRIIRIITGIGGLIFGNNIYNIKSTTADLEAIAALETTMIYNNTINDLEQWYGSINIYGIYAESNNSQISNNKIRNIPGKAIYIAAGSKNNILGNICKDNGQLIDLAYCESVTPPAIQGEVANTLTQCTYARSDVQEYEGAYSYLLTKIIAAGTAATAYLTDSAAINDLHGLYAGQEYRFGCWVYIPAGGMTGAELTLVIRDYVAAWEEQTQACANTYDAWQYVEVTKTLRAGSGGATFGFAIASTAAINETAYTDNLRLTPMGTGNLHNQNFYDTGTNTYIGV